MEFTKEQLNKFAEYANITNTTTGDVANSVSKAINGNQLPLNLQFFAEEEPPAAGPPADQDPPAGDPKDKTPEEIELEKKIEAESDRKLAKALDKKQKEWEAQQQKAIDDALAEKERLSKLSEKERKDEELSKREQDLEKRLADIERKELLADAVSDLNKKELPAEFAEVLLGENAEKTLENINSFKTAFDKAVNDAVKEKLRQETPPGGGDGTGKGTSSIAQLRNKKDQQQNKAPDIWA